MSWEETLGHYGALIEGKLRECFKEARNVAKAYHPFIEKVYSNLEEFVLRKGKRLASCSTLLTYKGYTGDIDEQILKACVGIELYRHCILVHDDLIDKDNLRRRGKTLHRLFAKNHDTRFGEGAAVFVGNLMYTLAQQSLLNSGFPQEKLGKATLLLSEGHHKVNESQILDLLFEYKEPDIDEWYTMASKRAASLFKTTILAGAILSDAPEGDLQVLEEAATHIGYSFDITDDLIDTFTTEEQYGRPPGGDLVQRKKPLHIVCTLKRASPSQREVLKTAFEKKPLPSELLESVRDIVRETGALDFARERSKFHAEKAKAAIAWTQMSGEVKEGFYWFIDYVQKSLDWYR